jgi:hypothetical protein
MRMGSGSQLDLNPRTFLLKVQALVFVGDAMEENPDDLAHDEPGQGILQ